MDVLLYKFWDNKWVETKRLTEKDVSLIIDKDNKIIYIWEGHLSSARAQTTAKNSLGDKKLQFPDFKFRLANIGLNVDIEAQLNNALQDSEEIKAKLENNRVILDQIIRALGLVSICLLLIIIGFLLGQIRPDTDYYDIMLQNFDNKFAYAQFMQIIAFLGIVAGFMIMGQIVLGYHLQQFNRVGFHLFTLIVLYYLIFVVWVNYNELIIISFYGDFNLSFSEPYNPLNYLVMNSTIILSFCIILLLLGIYFPQRINNSPRKA